MASAIISDIHSNLEALEAVLADIAQHKISEIYCLGDLVGYGPNPKECLKIIRKRNIPSVRGNHDEVAVSGHEEIIESSKALSVLRWTRQQLDEQEKDYLKSLPYTLEKDRFIFVHGELSDPLQFHYIFNSSDAFHSFSILKPEQILFVGHTHSPVCWRKREITYFQREKDQTKRLYHTKAIINAGSVGQPRDGDPKACWIELNEDKKVIVKMHRVAYDYTETQTKLLELGLIDKISKEASIALAYRLGKGK